MRHQMGPLAERLEGVFDVSYPDAPYVCSKQSSERLWRSLPPPRGVRTPRTWWHASDDGSSYAGWERTVDSLAALLRESDQVGLLGFSQGAMVAALLSAMGATGRVPLPAFAVFICGALPRAADLVDYFCEPIAVPSLHVIGRKDTLMKDRPAQLADNFRHDRSRVIDFDGGHAVPRRGPAADEIVEFACQFVR